MPISFTIFILKLMVDLLTPNRFTISANFAFSLNFLKTFSCWYAKQTMFMVLPLMISSNSQTVAAPSSVFYLSWLFLFALLSFIIDNRIFKLLLYFFLWLSCFISCSRDAVKVMYLKSKNKVGQVLKQKSIKQITRKNNYQF